MSPDRSDSPSSPAGLFNGRAIAIGAAVALVVAVPTIVVASVAGIDADSNAVFIAFLVYLAGEALGGWQAARREPDAPLSNGAAAAVVAYILIAVVASIIRSSRGVSLDPVSLILNAFLAASAGIFGGMVTLWRRRPEGDSPGKGRAGRRGA